MIVAVFGLPGTGKSFFAKKLASVLNAVYLSTDQVRRQLRHNRQYSDVDKEQVYHEVFARAEEHLQQKHCVVIDGTFSKQKVREALIGLAESRRAALCWIQLTADEAMIRKRVSKKRPDSDADFAVYQKIKADFDTPDFVYLTLDSGKSSPDHMLLEAKQYIFSHHGSTPNPTADQ